MYAALPVFSSWLIETGWTRAYWSVDQVGGIGPYLLYTLAYARARAHTHAACGVHTMPAHSRLARLFTGCIVLYVKAHTRTHTHPRARTHTAYSRLHAPQVLWARRDRHLLDAPHASHKQVPLQAHPRNASQVIPPLPSGCCAPSASVWTWASRDRQWAPPKSDALKIANAPLLYIDSNAPPVLGKGRLAVTDFAPPGPVG
jgi:hypothetical protein